MKNLLTSLAFLALLSVMPAAAQQVTPIGPNAPCTAFGTASGQCAQGGVITGAGPTGSATVTPIITYNAAGQLTTVTSATVTPAVGSITGLGTGVATLLAGTPSGTVGLVGTTSPTLVTQMTLNSGAFNTLLMGKCTGATTYNCIGLNGTLSAFLGIEGGASGDGNIYVVGTNQVVLTPGTGLGVQLNSTIYANCTALTTSSNVIACTVSDRRVKNDEGAVSVLRSLGAVASLPVLHKFQYKNGYGPAGNHYGWWAQDIMTTLPELVHRGQKTALTPDGELQFDKDEVVPLIAGAVKGLTWWDALLTVWLAVLTWFVVKRK